jgi:type I restriction enzyme M protein
LAKRNNTDIPNGTFGTVGYEAQLWQMADDLRVSMDAAEYKHVCLSLIFLKYISDAFEEQHAKLVADKASAADPGDQEHSLARRAYSWAEAGRSVTDRPRESSAAGLAA